MSDIFIPDIVGAGIYAVPTSQAELDDAAAGFKLVIDTAAITVEIGPGNFADLIHGDIFAWVRDNATAEGGSGTRSLCMFMSAIGLDPAIGDIRECLTPQEMIDLFADIRSALEAVVGMTSVGDMNAVLYISGDYNVA